MTVTMANRSSFVTVFNASEALKGKPVQTLSGKKVRVCCESRGKLLCEVISHCGRHMNEMVKYNLDGSRWSAGSPSIDDLTFVDAA